MKRLPPPVWVICLLLLTVPFSPSGAQNTPGRPIPTLKGAGATFPTPLYAALFEQYRKATGKSVDYQPIGSGGGIRALRTQQVDFAASDCPLSPEEAKSMPGPVTHLPSLGEIVALLCNLPGSGADVQLTGPLVADIYLGRISRWNDPRLQAVNPGRRLPNLAIIPIHVKGGSYKNALLTDYLCKVSPVWKARVGAGRSVNWPVGFGATMADALVAQTKGALCYTDYMYAIQDLYMSARIGPGTHVHLCKIRNQSGRYVSPSLANASAALEATVSRIQQDVCASVTDAPGLSSYPIVGYTYLLVPDQSATTEKRGDLVKVLQLLFGPGQKQAAALRYPPLPKAIVHLNEHSLTRFSRQESSTNAVY